MATIHPYKGYLNTKFHLFAKGDEDIRYEIFSVGEQEDSLISSGIFSPGIPHFITLMKAGSLRIVFSDGSSHVITVEDGYKFGGSKYKKSYIFDECRWAFVIMHDRTYFYNRETDESYVEPVSPDTIDEVSAEYVILGNSNHPERTVYSLEEQKPILNVENIVYYNADAIIWEEDKLLIIYSLKERGIVARITPLQYRINHEYKQLIYADAETGSISMLDIFNGFEKNEIYHGDGDFLCFADNEISIYSPNDDDRNHRLRIVNHMTGDMIKEIAVDGAIAAVNGRTLINVAQRNRAIWDFDLIKAEMPEAMITARYHEFIFYPCKWDIFYMQRTTAIIKQAMHYDRPTTISLHSIHTALDQQFERFENKVLITNNRFLLYNESESFVRSEKYAAAGYLNQGQVRIHNNTVILDDGKSVSTLSPNGYWDRRIECNYTFEYFEKYGVVSDRDTESYHLFGYNIKGKDIKFGNMPIDHISIGNSVSASNGKVYYNRRDFPSFSKKTNAASPGMKLALNVDTTLGKVFLLSQGKGNESCREILGDVFESDTYHQVLMEESGNHILYRDSDKAEIRNIQTGEITTFDNLSYIEHCNGFRPLFRQATCLAPQIINPVTGQLLDCKLLKDYCFISPDRRFYAGTTKDMYEEIYYLDSGNVISRAEYRKLLNLFDYTSCPRPNSAEWNQVTSNRIKFIKEHFEFINATYPLLTRDSADERKWRPELIDRDNKLNATIFLNRVIGIRNIASIRLLSDDSEVARIDLGTRVLFINYVAFSNDSRYVALAGCLHARHGLFLMYDLEENKMLWRINTDRAVWTAAFSSDDVLAAHTSTPHTFCMKGETRYVKVYAEESDLPSIKRRSFLTFSPDGSLIALSDIGYVAKNSNNRTVNEVWGHQPSTFVEVRTTADIDNSIATFNDLSNCGIDGSSEQSESVASVSFSNDNRRLMMVGKDGVVIIRNMYHP